MDLKFFSEQIFFSTVRITLPDQTNNNSSIGTGFLLKMPIKDFPEKAIVLLISNKHVFNNPKRRIILHFHKKGSDGMPKLDDYAVVDQIDFTDIYYEHPNPDIDLACINLSVIDYPENNIYFRNLEPGIFIDYNHKKFLPGADVWFVGYPDNRFDISHNLPILRRGYIASIPKVDFNGKKEFIIDAQVFPGSSGSPVFTILDNHFKFCGVIAQTMIKNEKLQSIPAGMSLGVQQTIGLGIVIKSDLVMELLDYVNENFSEKIKKENI